MVNWTLSLSRIAFIGSQRTIGASWTLCETIFGFGSGMFRSCSQRMLPIYVKMGADYGDDMVVLVNDTKMLRRHYPPLCALKKKKLYKDIMVMTCLV